jgi:hypothetical protein
MWNEKELKKDAKGMGVRVTGSLLFFDDYLEGAGYGTGRADYLTLTAPLGAGAAFFLSNYRHNVTVQHQDFTRTHADTQATAVALILIYYGHISQCHPSILYFSLIPKSTNCM